jgi:hypothetical protein
LIRKILIITKYVRLEKVKGYYKRLHPDTEDAGGQAVMICPPGWKMIY